MILRAMLANILRDSIFHAFSNSRDRKENPCSASQRTKHITSHRQSTNTGTPKCSRRGDNSLQLFVHTLLAMAGHDKTLVLELLRDVSRCRARNLNPCFREQSAGNDDKQYVYNGVDRVEQRVGEVQRRRHVVRNARGG